MCLCVCARESSWCTRKEAFNCRVAIHSKQNNYTFEYLPLCCDGSREAKMNENLSMISFIEFAFIGETSFIHLLPSFPALHGWLSGPRIIQSNGKNYFIYWFASFHICCNYGRARHLNMAQKRMNSLILTIRDTYDYCVPLACIMWRKSVSSLSISLIRITQTKVQSGTMTINLLCYQSNRFQSYGICYYMKIAAFYAVKWGSLVLNVLSRLKMHEI